MAFTGEKCPTQEILVDDGTNADADMANISAAKIFLFSILNFHGVIIRIIDRQYGFSGGGATPFNMIWIGKYQTADHD